MTQWRALLESIRVPWRDRGPNTSRGHINVKCPWCGSSDPSFHLGIHEESGAYRCLRAPHHAGRSPYFLLLALGVDYDAMDGLLRAYGSGESFPRPAAKAPPISAPAAEKRWQFFDPAFESDEALSYLTGRKFRNPASTARYFDLRVGTGRWAGRVWFPFVREGSVIGFTGRSMRGATPPYQSEAADSVLYLPLPLVTNETTLMLVEGPMDALRLADAIRNRYNIFVAALCGLALTPSKRLQLLALSQTIKRFYVVLDSSVPLPNVHRLMAELKPLPLTVLERLSLPAGVGDPGEMEDEQIWQWMDATGILTG